MQASGSLRAFRHLTPASCSTIWEAKMFFLGQFFSMELKCRWTAMQASGSPRVPSHLTQGGTILCRAVGIGATCHSKGIWNKLHGHQTFIAFNTKYGAWLKEKYSRGGIWQYCSFKAYFFLENKKLRDSPPPFVNCVQEMYLMVLWAQCFPSGLQSIPCTIFSCLGFLCMSVF